jgi:hypothetical protein
MNKKLSKKNAVSAAVVAHNALYPLLVGLQDQTQANVDAGASRSKAMVETLIALRANSTDYAADCIVILGDGLKGTKKDAGTKGTLADELAKAYGDKLHVSVRSQIAIIRKVAANIDVPAVREAAPKGIRAMYDTLKAKTETTVVDAAPAAAAYSQAMMVALVAEHFDDAVFAMRAYLLRAADAIGVNKIGELEVHLHSKTRTK